MPGSTSAGTSSAQRSVAFQQRVRNRQPDGGSVGVGASPVSTMRRRPVSTSGSGIGAADSSAWVYGWAERSYTSVGRPGLDDPPEVHDGDPVADVADDGQVVGDEQEPEVELGAQPLEQPDDLGLDADVERRDRLVEHEQVGADGERRAMPMRWRWPPENWCG